MSIKLKLNHIGAQVFLGTVMLLTASANTLGTQNAADPLLKTQTVASPAQLLREGVKQERLLPERHPSCTPGFKCSTTQKVTSRVSRKEAVRFALFMGAGSIH